MLEHLKDVAPFDTLSDAELDPLVSRATVRKYKKNTLVIHQGDETTAEVETLGGTWELDAENRHPTPGKLCGVWPASGTSVATGDFGKFFDTGRSMLRRTMASRCQLQTLQLNNR